MMKGDRGFHWMAKKLKGGGAVTGRMVDGGDSGVLLGGQEGGEGKVRGRVDKRGAGMEAFTAS